MNNRIVIIGAGGHGRVAADIAKLIGYDEIIFLDDADIPGVNGKCADHVRYIGNADFFIAIGNNSIRDRLQNEIQENGGNIVSLIHPHAVIGSNVTIGKGTVIMAGVVVNAGAKIGKGVILNTSSSVDHDCIIGDYCHISVGAHLAGTVSVGKHTMIGAGATVINNVVICSGCTVGAGTVVIRNLKECGAYVGVPAKRLLVR